MSGKAAAQHVVTFQAEQEQGDYWDDAAKWKPASVWKAKVNPETKSCRRLQHSCDLVARWPQRLARSPALSSMPPNAA